MQVPAPALLPILKENPYLNPWKESIYNWHYAYKGFLAFLKENHGSLKEFASIHEFLGLHYSKKDKGWYYREWAPSAFQLFLIGDFNEWNHTSHPLSHLDSGYWEIFIPDVGGKSALAHGSLYKVLVNAANGHLERISPYVRRVVQDDVTKDFAAQVWNPAKPYKFKSKWKPDPKQPVLIYEAHVGMAQQKEAVGTYKEFTDLILPKVKKLGYNTIQLMAIQEHPYYGSYGYHVSSFFAPSSRFGTPEELKELVDTAHSMGIAVIMDLVHSHAVKNIFEGLDMWDGSQDMYFHRGDRGNHPAWDSKCFNYGKLEVQQFLLSNVRYWLEEFNFDGYRFDGVTSMLYHHHGLSTSFGSLDDYYNGSVDSQAILYLQLANDLAHEISPTCITVAEDVSGLPGLGWKAADGGVGFDYRLGMGIPDHWIKLLKEKADDEWSMGELWGVLTNRRYDEKTIAYAESHDQALVGDQTLAFRLMESEMYFSMTKLQENLRVDRGIALHKMIRLLTIAIGGDSYLNFMGNEFGHPDWIDFPREGNNWSYKHAQRLWSLREDQLLKYHYLGDFDEAMIKLVNSQNLFAEKYAHQLHVDEGNKILIFERQNLMFLFNFHPTHSIFDYQFHTRVRGKYKLVLNSDSPAFGGFNRIEGNDLYETFEGTLMRVYLPNRSALVFERVEEF
jgi:1,4-alpha-glucan branching enzyme